MLSLSLFKTLRLEWPPPLTPELVERVCSYKRFPQLGLSNAIIREAAEQALTYAEFISSLFREFSKLQGKKLAGEKCPFYSLHISLLHALFPWAKIIHIIRDGRDTALSAFEWREEQGPGEFKLWAESPVAVTALWWKWRVTAGRQAGKDLGPNHYFEVKYEELVIEPDKILQDLSSFLEVQFAPEMLTYYEGKTRIDPKLSSKKRWLPPTQGLRDWQTQLARRDIEIFEALSGDLLQELGYERGCNSISPEIVAIAEKYQKLWTAEMEQRQAEAGNSATHPYIQ